MTVIVNQQYQSIIIPFIVYCLADLYCWKYYSFAKWVGPKKRSFRYNLFDFYDMKVSPCHQASSVSVKKAQHHSTAVKSTKKCLIPSPV